MASLDLNFQLHDVQLEIVQSGKRFKIAVAGRRWGKSFVSVVMCLINGMMETNSRGYNLRKTDVWYIAPTFESGKRNVWRLFKELGGYGTPESIIKTVHENSGIITLINGRRIEIKGADRPDSLRGVGLSFVVMDEYASMKPEVWELIIAPTLMDVEGDAFFIGTPAGKNHFYHLYSAAQENSEDWDTWTESSHNNPFLNPKEVERMTANLSESAIRQEIDASFEAEGGGSLRGDLIKFISDDEYSLLLGDEYVTVDPAGFSEVKGKVSSKLKKLDECAICRTLVHKAGWHIHEIDHGRWGVRETATRIMRAYQKSRPIALGVEKGALRLAILPYLQDEQMRLKIGFGVKELTHGNQKKTDRIIWALQGRLEKRKITILESERNQPWVRKLISQMFDFPNALAHDDLPDALAYTDQIAKTNYLDSFDFPEFEPLDSVAGY